MELGIDVIKVPITKNEREIGQCSDEKNGWGDYQAISCLYPNILRLLTKLVPFYLWQVTCFIKKEMKTHVHM